jgi:hypothetical protein
LYEKACKHFAADSKYICSLDKCSIKLFNEPNWLQWKDTVIAVPVMLPAKDA